MSEALTLFALKKGKMETKADLKGLTQSELGMLILNMNYILDDLKMRYYKLIKK